MQQLIESGKWVNHTNEVVLETDNMLSVIKDAETAQRGYLLTSDATFLEPYTNAYARAMTSYNRVKALTSDNKVQQKTLADVKTLINAKFSQMRRVITAASRENAVGLASALKTQSSLAEMQKGKEYMDDLRLLVQQMKEEENRLLNERTQKLNTYTTYTPFLVTIAALISVIITVLAYMRIRNDLAARVQKQLEAEAEYRRTNKRIASLETVTRQIAGGEYTARSADDEQDQLGRISVALNDMAAALEKNFSDLQNRNWLQEGAVKIGDAIRGERHLGLLCSNIINTIAHYLDAPAGTLYVQDDDGSFRLKGSYAASNAPLQFTEEDGLHGQVIKDKQLLVVEDLPEGYISINSTLGGTQPVNIMMMPILYAHEAIGIIELALLQPVSDLHKELLKTNAEAIGIGIAAALNYKQLQNLLEETQAQAEELQTQHGELENLNAELEAQAQKLQASEEELRVQQEELQQTNQELEERGRSLEEKNMLVLERNLEIQKKAEELALTTRYKSEFLANMSHELRTPLNSILLLSRLLAENTEHNLSDDQVEYARVIQSSGNGLLSLIDEILDLSKIEAGKMQLEYGNISVRELSGGMRSLFEPLAREKNLSFHISIAEDAPPFIETDRMRVEQVLKNLLSNALKFTTKGSVTLSIAAHNGRISFAVKDTGIGIPQDKQQMVFEAFQQADGSTRRKYGGTGLGLSISRELARLLGGEISLTSEPGQGSIFTLVIPVQKPDATEENEDETLGTLKAAPVAEHTVQKYESYKSATIPDPVPDDREGIRPGEQSILIVEDDVHFAKILLDYTHKEGYKGIVSVRGDEAMELAMKHKPSGILLDIQLPVKSGWEVMEELKASPHTRHIPVHIVSSHQVKKESLMMGAVDFVSKPVSTEEMHRVFDRIERALNSDQKKVLIVEENPMHAKALAYFLDNYNVNSEIKNSIEESVSALTGSGPGCVILDMGIPDQKGYDTLEEIKKNAGLENLPIIIFTGKSLSRAEEQRIKQYADSIVVKTAHSYRRILDEVSLFLHLVEENKTDNKATDSLKKLGNMNQVLRDKTVLIADDDVRNIFSLTKALEQLKMNVLTAVDGKDALRQLEEHNNVDIVLMDMMMPQMDGYESTTAIRRNPKWKNLPVIAVTAKAMTGDREKCINAGASDYITKPVDIDQLLSLLRVWLYDRS
jgi:signal transduction histidine kinase/DNA-binding response OmpR family regulator